ncbi:hypothetical protein FKP32DRAFT_1598784 [Trametes sanguinea]|nr:hypothetical protein FKP32DRAFT_1598784 [Trametes sanguinea]
MLSGIGKAMQPQSADDVRRYVAIETQSRLKALDELTNELVSLRRLHNSVAPIHRLPPEVFCAVFEHLRDEKGDVSEILNITHICQHWREVAFNAAKLWSVFYINKVEMTKAFLERSRLHPLTLYLSEPRDPVGRIAKLVAPHVERLRVLRVCSSEDRTIVRLLDRFISEAPQLEELAIEKDFRHRVITIHRLPIFTSLPRLFGGSLPCNSLRTLKLRNVSLLTSFSAPSVLVNFEMHQCSMPDGRFSVRTLLEFLQNCPLLERVCIASMSVPGAEVPPGLPIVNLPRLRTLNVISAPDDILRILSGLSIPRTAHVHLETLYTQPGAGGYDFIPTDQTQLPFFAGVKRLELFLEKHRIILRGFHTAEAQVECAFEIKILMLLGMAPLPAYLANWPFDRLEVESLVIVGPRMERAELGTGTMYLLMAQFPLLKSLRVVTMNAVNAKTLFQVLRTDGDPVWDIDLPEDDPNVPYTLCRRLESLEICDLTVDAATKKPILEIVGKRANGGALKEVDLSLVMGWTQEDTRKAMELGGDVVVVNVDDCEE